MSPPAPVEEWSSNSCAPDAAARPDSETQIAGLVFAVLVVDPRQVVRSVNPAAEDLLGKSASRMEGARLFDIVRLEDSHVADYLAAGNAPLVARGVMLRTEDRDGRFNVTASPVPGFEGWRTITLSESGQDDGEGADQRMLRTPAVLAHEIKNPLSAIRGAGQLIARKLDAKDRPLARMIGDEVDRIARLIDRMQRLGSETPDPVGPVNLHSTIRNAIATVQAAAPDAPAIVEEFDPSLPPVLASADALEQVLINLLSNARDACSDAREPKVAVRTRFVGGLTFRSLLPGRALNLPIEVCVTDNGPGIDPAVRDQIFQPFVSSKPHGQGLGLALVRKLLGDMHGRISHERDERAGLTLFRIRLAVANAGADEPEGPPA